MGDEIGEKLEYSTWVCETLAKEAEFDLERTKNTFMEPKKSFYDASTSGRKDRPEPKMDPSMLTMFLETCMKLLHNYKAINGMQELINRCTGTRPRELCIVWKIGKHKTRTGREVSLTTQIGEYEMDQIIIDLRLNTSVLPKQTWARMGKPML